MNEQKTIGIWWEPVGDGALGFYTGCHDYITCGSVDAYVATDKIIDGFEKLFGVSVPEEWHSKHRNARSTVNQHGFEYSTYKEMYDDEMLQWVANADADMIDRFGFKPFQPSPQAIYRMR